MIGTQLGAYEIVAEVGRGGMATVYRAYQPTMERFVALKVIQKSILVEENATERFQLEARLVARLEHPHILPVHDFDATGDPPYIVMRYLDGGTLKDIMQRGPLPLPEIAYLIRQIGSALDYAHRQGVVHRDIKPTNIMIDQDGNAFVTDFGIARIVEKNGSKRTGGLTEPGMIIGTPEYISPEQVMGREDVDYRADIYAIGVLLYHLLIQELPFKSESVVDTMHQHVHDPVPSVLLIRPELPPAVDLVLQRALAKQPDDRFPLMADFVSAAVNALGGVASVPTTLRAAAATCAQETHEKQERSKLEGGSSTGLARTTTRDTQGTPTDQHRQISVLYANLADFEETLIDTLDSEETADLMQRLFQQFDQVITASGGKIYERTGQTILALWGLAGAREDDPEQTVRTALALRDVLHTTAAEFLEPDEDLPLQIAVNTGSVLQQSASTSGTVTITGQTLTAARRLEQAAPPGCILMSEDTYRHVIGVFDIVPYQGLRVRGRKESLESYQVLRARPRAFRMSSRGVEGVETKMIGRDAELKLLQDMLILAIEDKETQIVTCIGEAGVGKSRLLYELSRWIDGIEQKIVFFQGRATPQSVNLPYALLRDVFSFRFEILDSDPLPVVRAKFEQGIQGFLGAGSLEKAHFIAHLVGFDFSDSPYLQVALKDAGGFHSQALGYLHEFFRAIPSRNPAIVELEDIHWADTPSLDLINQLVNENRHLPLMIICMARPELFERRKTWGEGQPFHQKVMLTPLTKVDSRRLVREVLQKVDNVPNDLRDLIVERAEGNPFYVEELIKVLIEDRVIVKAKGADEHWQIATDRLAGVRVPTTLAGVLQARLDALPQTEQLLLQRASVIGRIFWDTALEALAQADGTQFTTLNTLLDNLRRRELIFRRDSSAFAGTHEFIIKHAILRDVIYDNLSKRQQRNYHAAAAEWFLATSGDRASEYTALIAEHYERAGENAKAAAYLNRASEQAAGISAYEQAIASAQQALKLVEKDERPDGKAQRINALIRLGEVTSYKGAHQEAKGYLQPALALARELGDRQRVALVLGQLGRIGLWLGNHDEATRYLEEALPLAREFSDLPSVVFILRQLGNISNDKAQFENAKTYLEESLSLARVLGDTAAVSAAYNSLGISAHSVGDYPKALACYEEGLAIARSSGQRYLTAMSLGNIAATNVLTSDFESVRRCAQEALAIAQEIGGGSLEAMALGVLGIAAIELGDEPGALDYLNRAGRMYMAIGEVPQQLALIGGYARLRGKFKADPYAVDLLGVVINHPATQENDRLIARELLKDLRSRTLAALTDQEVETRLAHGQTLDVETLMSKLVPATSAPAA